MKKGIIPVIIITILIGLFMLLYAFAILVGIIEAEAPPIALVIAVGIILSVFGALVYTSYDRIKEINEEDEDDLSKY